jgi:asparagine synthase (glutamine-hydrolysing)
MCGISGIINKKDIPVHKVEIKAINDLIIHRGPDSEGYYFGPCLSFGHRRLSILDITSSGNQPMSYLDRYWITYNGEIYNYIEIRDELVLCGYKFASGTDTEVILAAYDKWESDCLTHFNGMFAFVIHDKEKNILFFARDRFGIKPLYYKEDDTKFVFGSEIKQLLNPKGSNIVSQDVLLEYMLTHVDNHTRETYFKDVFSFPSSHYMIYNLKNHTKSFFRYYELKVDESIKRLSEESLIEKFKETFVRAINIRLRSDVKVGTCLSGGLDSSAISYIASGMYNTKSKERFIAVNAKSTDAYNDESDFAKIVAEKIGLDLKIVTPHYDDFVKVIDEVIYTQEEPFGSPSMFMGWYVFKMANNLNCKVMLNGQGGDEILLGYDRYYAATFDWRNIFSSAKQIFLQYKNSRLSFFKTLGYFIYFLNAPLRVRRLKMKSLLKKEYKDERYFNNIRQIAKSFKNPETLQILEITKLQLPHLLRYEDRNSMRHSIETRLPFLDYNLVELAISLPINLKIKEGWTKVILRKAIDGVLPDEIVWRKNKFGFESPSSWISQHSSKMLLEIKDSKILNNYCEMNTLIREFNGLSDVDKWLYFSIARWEKVYNVVLPPGF